MIFLINKIYRLIFFILLFIMPFQILCVYEDIDTSSVFINITDPTVNKRLSTLENEINQLNKELAKNNEIIINNKL